MAPTPKASSLREYRTGSNGSRYADEETRRFANGLRFVACTTAVRSPRSNGMAEAFVKTFKQDCVYFVRSE